MATNNESGLSDYFANALGGGVKFETAKFHNFQFGVSGYFIILDRQIYLKLIQ
jgi:hypothetical protein